MATEQGIVVKVGIKAPNIALVKTAQTSACKACSARHHCNPDTKGQEREVEAINMVNAEVGDVIQISMDNSSLLKASFLLYVFPIICMLVGASAGHALGTGMGMGPSTLSAIVGVVFFISAMLIVRNRAGHMALKQKYQPKITRIIGREKIGGESSDPPDDCGQRMTNGI